MIKRLLNTYIADESGATALEYAIFVAIFSVALMTVWSTAGEDILPNFETISDNLDLNDAEAEPPVVED